MKTGQKIPGRDVLKKKKNNKRSSGFTKSSKNISVPTLLHVKKDRPKFVFSLPMKPKKQLPLDPEKLKAILIGSKQSIKVGTDNAPKISRNEHNAKPVPKKTENTGISFDTKHVLKKKSEDLKRNVLPHSSEIVQEKAKGRLRSAKFRFLNEKLYTSTGVEALTFFQEDPSNFQVYHTGFQQQVEKWPVNPLDIIIEELKEISPDLILADFGCGDAKIARTFPERTVHSFDLFALNDYVTVCDMAKVPMENGCVDICIFCLSLMGTNLMEYIREASRILRLGGFLKIAEVKSRFDDQESFKKTMKAFGFRLKKEDWTNTMFTLMEFKKKRHTPKKCDSQNFQLSPCFYKKR